MEPGSGDSVHRSSSHLLSGLLRVGEQCWKIDGSFLPNLLHQIGSDNRGRVHKLEERNSGEWMDQSGRFSARLEVEDC